MDEGDEVAVRRGRRRWRRALRWLGVLLALVLVVGTVAWLQRTSIATGFVDRELAKRGVPATYKIADVGLSTQRLTDVVIGDPKAPDLTADWIEIYTRVGLNGVEVRGIAVGKAFVRARLAGSTLSLGAIDKLLPASSGKPFALPAIDARLRDVRARLTTNYGQIGIKLTGNGRLNDGFNGRIAAFAYRLDGNGCWASRPGAVLAVRIAKGAPTLTGPIQVNFVTCDKDRPLVQQPGGQVTVRLNDRLDHWQGRGTQFGAAAISAPGMGVNKLYGKVAFTGDARRTTGTADMLFDDFDAPDLTGREGSLNGRFAVGSAGTAYSGNVTAKGAKLSNAILGRVLGMGAIGAGTPVKPIAERIAGAVASLGGGFDLSASIDATPERVRVPTATIAGHDDGRVTLTGAPLRFGMVEVGGSIATSGGGLPEARIALAGNPDGTVTGRAVMRPYQAFNALLALTPVNFIAGAAGVTHVTTTATLSGPLGNGRLEAASLPIDARWRDSVLSVNPGCAPLAWQRVTVSGLALDPARLTLCPIGGALVTLNGGRLGGGARIASPRLTGTLGGTPLALSAGTSELRFSDASFSLIGVLAQLGMRERLTRIGVKQLSGALHGDTVAGAFDGADGQIGNVPLLLSDSTGTWRLVGGRLTLNGKLQVADAAPEPRFKPMMSDDVALTLIDSRIAATGSLRSPKGAAKVADVVLRHDLSSAKGSAHLIVPGISFAERGLQPDDLTPLTFGVIAAVDGNVVGRGDIAWDANGVTSTGNFRTDGIDLAAAFGPVTGIKGEIAFTDLLGLVSAPGQVATIATVNPGVPVENGTVRYQLAGGAKVAVEEGRWPFAGGELLLEPTVMDFGTKEPRHMTFRVTGVDAAQFLQQFDFKNLDATGTFDGSLPMIFDESGGRIEGGSLIARGPGGIAYVGEITQQDAGFWGNLAFQALKALDYKDLTITMNGPLAGEMITQLKFDGISQGAGTHSNFLIKRLAKLPFVFNIQVRAPFRQLIDSVQSYYDPSRLIERNLPSLIEDYNRQHPEAPLAVPPTATPPVIQPSESEKRP